jgi:hypothetical protein
MAINPLANSGQFWVVTDSSGSTSGPTGGFSGGSQSTLNGGRVLRMTYKSLLTLPVDFLTFNGRLLYDRTIQLNWTTSESQDHLYFDVEKSNTNQGFVPIGRIVSAPPYRFIDVSPSVGHNYYRIKEMTTSGKVVYSKVIDIIYESKDILVTSYPNPVQDHINFKMSALRSKSVMVNIKDMQGKTVFGESFKVDPGTREIQVNCKNWASQLYVLTVTDQNGDILYSERVFKNR